MKLKRKKGLNKKRRESVKICLVQIMVQGLIRNRKFGLRGRSLGRMRTKARL